jgi:uncharacterized protein YjiS (DUF1127 family)
MSTPFGIGDYLFGDRHCPAIGSHQISSWPGWSGLLSEWLRRSECNRQRAALRDLADDRHLLDDLGLTRQQALDEADRPFWH